MQQGAVAALYYSDRLCDVPLGIVGLPVAVAIFPLLCRHAARGDHRQLGADMTLGLRLVLCLSIPAGVGLILLAQPITRLVFERGNFTPEDTHRVAWLIDYYGAGVWANCAWPVVVRGFYALNDYRTPVRVGVWVVSLNLAVESDADLAVGRGGLGDFHHRGHHRAVVHPHGDLFAPPGPARLARLGCHQRTCHSCHRGYGRRGVA